MTGQQIDRDRLRELASGATPGPWEAQDYDDHPGDEGSCVLTHEPERGTRAIAYAIAYPWTTPESCEADAEFIAASRQAVPALLDMLDQAEAERDQAQAALDRVRELHQPCTHDAPCRGDCAECGQPMPCDTIRALDGEQ